MFPAVGAAKPKKPKPDLVVQGFQFVPAPGVSGAIPHVVLEADGTGAFSLSYRVKNVGKGRAPGSDVGVIVNETEYARFHVKPLAPGKRAAFTTAFNRQFAGPGFYNVSLCADFAEKLGQSGGDNDCTSSVRVRAVPRRWQPDYLDLSSTFNGIHWFTNARVLDFTYEGIAGDTFYWLASGPIFETVSGGAGDCTISGSGSVTYPQWFYESNPVGFLSITAELNLYTASVEDTGATYTATSVCPPPPEGSGTMEVDEYIEPVQTYDQSGGYALAMASNAKVLAGEYVGAEPYATHTYRWSFKADVP